MFGVSTQQISSNPNGGTQTPKNWVPEIHFIHHIRRRKKLKISIVKLFLFKSNQKGGDIDRKLDARADPGRIKVLKCTLTPVIYNGCPRFRWQTHKCVIADSAVIQVSDVSNMGGSRLKKKQFSGILRIAYRKSFNAYHAIIVLKQRIRYGGVSLVGHNSQVTTNHKSRNRSSRIHVRRQHCLLVSEYC